MGKTKVNALDLARDVLPGEIWERAQGPRDLPEPRKVEWARALLARRASIEVQARVVYEAVLASGEKGDKPEVEVAFFIPCSDDGIFGPPREVQGREFTLRLQFEIAELEQRAAVQTGGGSSHPFQLAEDVFTPAVPTSVHVKYFAWTGKKVKQVVLRSVEVIDHGLPQGWNIEFDFTKTRQLNIIWPDGRRFYELGELPYKVGEEAVVTRKE